MYIKIEDFVVTDINIENVDNTYYFIYDDIPVNIGHNVTFDKNGNITGFYTGQKINHLEQELINLSNEIRQRRDYLLQETDWIVIKAVDTNTEIPNEWKIYRQSLRDITQHPNFPNLQEEDWPIKPN